MFVELESESGGYRDVAGQIERLSKVPGSRLIPVQEVLFVALLLETGLLLMLIPWSALWERNYFVEWSPVLTGAADQQLHARRRSPALAS